MVVGAGCQSGAAGAPPPTLTQVHFNGTFENGCSPVDASGLIFDLTTPQLDGWIQISMWAGFPLQEGATIELAMQDNIAVAAYCRATNDCEVAREGEMQLMHVSDLAIGGHLWLDLPQTGLMEGPFEVEWVDSGPVICG